MSGALRILIVGGGIGGMSLAIALKQADIPAEIVELDPDWRVYGAGITLTGPALRAFAQLGVLAPIVAEGYCADGTRFCDPAGNIMFETPPERILGADIPNGGGILRPVLHRILADATRATGTRVRLGVSVASLTQSTDTVEVAFTDGSNGSFDLVVGADGLGSRVRALAFADAPKPTLTGQGCWRAVLPRPAAIDRVTLYLGGPVKLGFNPVSQGEMYMFLLQHVPDNPRMPEEQLNTLLAEQMAGFSGFVGEARDKLIPAARIVYRPLEKLLLPAPWHRGRVLLIGDAAHSTTPHLASGAGIAVEDALVLASLLREMPVATALRRFVERRFERCRLVVENSARIGELELAGAPMQAQMQLSRDSATALARPF